MYPQIILLGDSLIQRCYDPETPSFGPALQHAYFRRADVINRGFGGYNTDWLLPVLENQIIPSVYNVVLWVVLIGANDAMLSPGPNHVPIDRYEQNLLKIINAIFEHHNSLQTYPRIILLTPPPISEPLIRQHVPHQASLRSRETTFSYAQAVMNLKLPSFVERANLHEAIELAPTESFFNMPQILEGDRINPERFENGGMVMGLEDYLSDGLHLKDPSYAIMYKLVMECIARRWPEILPTKMSMPVPWWGDIVAQAETQNGNQREEL